MTHLHPHMDRIRVGSHGSVPIVCFTSSRVVLDNGLLPYPTTACTILGLYGTGNVIGLIGDVNAIGRAQVRPRPLADIRHAFGLLCPVSSHASCARTHRILSKWVARLPPLFSECMPRSPCQSAQLAINSSIPWEFLKLELGFRLFSVTLPTRVKICENAALVQLIMLEF
ncbi:hypothetical protein GY45DRAFT_1095064 [Cubamyces sp. BRFM 1775]|nr:hypothetical protein GY45DRAFT_1095064 [Cubamyces sp. BRFM 1775]